MPLLFRKARRKFAELDAHDVAHRISAYTYGNFLVLAALLSIHDANAIFDGTAILYITGTGLTTYEIIFDYTILLCLATVVWRIFSLNFAIARYRGEPLCWRTFRSAVWLTFAVIVLAIVKIMFTHAGK